VVTDKLEPGVSSLPIVRLLHLLPPHPLLLLVRDAIAGLMLEEARSLIDHLLEHLDVSMAALVVPCLLPPPNAEDVLYPTASVMPPPCCRTVSHCVSALSSAHVAGFGLRHYCSMVPPSSRRSRCLAILLDAFPATSTPFPPQTCRAAMMEGKIEGGERTR
jgi:hypothetical protein